MADFSTCGSANAQQSVIQQLANNYGGTEGLVAHIDRQPLETK